MGPALRILRNILLVLAGIFALLFGAVCYVLYAHEQQIADELVATLNEGQTGKLSYGAVELSPFRAFPYVSVDIRDLRFDGDKHGGDDHAIYAFADVYVGFSAIDLLMGRYSVRNLVLSKGHLYLEKHPDGTWNIVRAKSLEASGSDSSATRFALKHIELRDVTLHEVNEVGDGNEVLLDILQAEAYVDAEEDEVHLGLESELFLYHYRSGSTTWFRELPFGLDCDLSIDGGVVRIKPSTFRVEAGTLDLEGSLDLDKDMLLDLHVSGRKRNFDVFISFAPPEMLEKLREFRNEGDIYFDGTIAGPLDLRSPTIDLRLGCEKTMFEHRRLGKALRDVTFSGHFRTGDDGGMEEAYLELVNLYGEPEKGLMRGTFRVDDLTDPRFTMDFHARFELEHLKAFYDVEAIRAGSGTVSIDITLDEYIGPDSVLHFATKMTDGVTSNITFKDVRLELSALSLPLDALNGRVILDGDDLRSEGLRMRIGKSDLAVDLALSKLSAILHHNDAPIELRLHGESNKLHLSEMLSLHGAVEEAPWSHDIISDLELDLDVRTTVDALDHSRYVPSSTVDFRHLAFKTAKYPFPIRDISGRISVNDERLHIEDLGITIGPTDLHASLDLKNLGALLDSSRREMVSHRISIASPYVNAKELLVYDSKPFVHDSIEEEVLHDLVFRGSGTLLSNTFTEHGFVSDTHIDRFSVRLNELPPLREVDGRIRTDTSGRITLDGLRMRMGHSDLKADLDLFHVKDHREIRGSIRAGHLDMDELLGWSAGKEEATTHEEAFNLFALAFPDMTLEVDIGRLTQHHRLVEELRGRVHTSRDHVVQVDTLHGRTAGGLVGLRGRFDGSLPDSIHAHADVSLDRVDLDKVLFKLDNFGQDFVVHENVHGRVSGTLRLDAHLHPDLVPDLAHTTAKADLRIVDGRLSHFAPLHALADLMGDSDLDDVRFGELENSFSFRDGALHIPEMRVTSTLGYLDLSGEQATDLSMDYTMRIPLGLVKRASWNLLKSKLRGTGRNKGDEDELEQADAAIITSQKGPIKGHLTMNITGTPDDYRIRLGRSKGK